MKRSLPGAPRLFTFGCVGRRIQSTSVAPPWPSAQTKLFGKRVKILETRVSDKSGEAGKVISVKPLTVACEEGSVEILWLQPEGKSAMSSDDYLKGHSIELGTHLGE